MNTLSITTSTLDLMSIFCPKEMIDRVIDDYKNHFVVRILEDRCDDRLLDDCLTFDPQQDYYNYWEVTEFLAMETLPLMEKCKVIMAFLFCDGNVMYKDDFCCCSDQTLLVHNLYKFGMINGQQHHELLHPYNEYEQYIYNEYISLRSADKTKLENVRRIWQSIQ